MKNIINYVKVVFFCMVISFLKVNAIDPENVVSFNIKDHPKMHVLVTISCDEEKDFLMNMSKDGQLPIDGVLTAIVASMTVFGSSKINFKMTCPDSGKYGGMETVLPTLKVWQATEKYLNLAIFSVRNFDHGEVEFVSCFTSKKVGGEFIQDPEKIKIAEDLYIQFTKSALGGFDGIKRYTDLHKNRF